MKLTKDFILDDQYNIRLSSKKLTSGRYQVKFYATVKEDKSLYGYLLVEAQEKLSTVVSKIRGRLETLDHTFDYHHFHLYHVGKVIEDEPNFMIFE